MGEAAVPALIDAFQHDNEAVRRNASYALSTIGKAAVPALLDACQDAERGRALHGGGDPGRLGQSRR